MTGQNTAFTQEADMDYSRAAIRSYFEAMPPGQVLERSQEGRDVIGTYNPIGDFMGYRWLAHLRARWLCDRQLYEALLRARQEGPLTAGRALYELNEIEIA